MAVASASAIGMPRSAKASRARRSESSPPDRRARAVPGRAAAHGRAPETPGTHRAARRPPLRAPTHARTPRAWRRTARGPSSWQLRTRTARELRRGAQRRDSPHRRTQRRGPVPGGTRGWKHLWRLRQRGELAQQSGRPQSVAGHAGQRRCDQEREDTRLVARAVEESRDLSERTVRITSCRARAGRPDADVVTCNGVAGRVDLGKALVGDLDGLGIPARAVEAEHDRLEREANERPASFRKVEGSLEVDTARGPSMNARERARLNRTTPAALDALLRRPGARMHSPSQSGRPRGRDGIGPFHGSRAGGRAARSQARAQARSCGRPRSRPPRAPPEPYDFRRAR